MSNTQGSQEHPKRDWNKPQSEALTKALAAFHIGKASLVHVFEEVESIVRRELAGEVEKIHAELSEGDDLVSSVWKDCADCFRDDLLALLSPHQNDAEESNV